MQIEFDTYAEAHRWMQSTARKYGHELRLGAPPNEAPEAYYVAIGRHSETFVPNHPNGPRWTVTYIRD
jgi:hypothetical protein